MFSAIAAFVIACLMPSVGRWYRLRRKKVQPSVPST
jgi:hypothetical protein